MLSPVPNYAAVIYKLLSAYPNTPDMRTSTKHVVEFIAMVILLIISPPILCSISLIFYNYIHVYKANIHVP